MKRIHLSAIAFAILVLCAIPSSWSSDKRFEKKFTVSPGESLTLSTDVGSIAIRGTSSNEVSIVAEIKGRERDVKDFEISATQSSSGVEVKGRSGRGGWRLFSWSDLDVHYTVTVPHSYNVKVHTSGGDVSVNDLKGTVRTQTSGGDLAIADIEGDVDVTTSGGRIQLERLSGNTQARTSGGDIKVLSAVGDIDIRTSGGDVRVNDTAGRVRAKTSGGNVTISLKGDNKGIFAETSGGNIDIALSPSVAATVEAETSGGDVSCDLPLTVVGKVKESRIHGTINGGGSTIHAHTSGGNIRIRAIDSAMK